MGKLIWFGLLSSYLKTLPKYQRPEIQFFTANFNVCLLGIVFCQIEIVLKDSTAFIYHCEFEGHIG